MGGLSDFPNDRRFRKIEFLSKNIAGKLGTN